MLKAQEKQDAIATLSSRPTYALALLDAIDQKKIPRDDVSVFTARQLQDLKDKQVNERLAKVWGTIRTTPGEKKAQITKYKKLLTAEVLAKADASRGRLVYNKMCAQCHMLYGEGKKIGPDLTGSGRYDLHYVLENIIDPSAVIGRDYQLTNIVTKGGRLVAGIVVEETDRAVTIQSATERITLAKDDIDERVLSPVSMMPEGQIEQMTFPELRDLVRYLATKEQVPLVK
jgi:putative heme-binding domain-containing protein